MNATPANFANELEGLRVLDRVQLGFIVGPPKTGTSWLNYVLQSHPHALALGEGHLADFLLPRIDKACESYINDLKQWGLLSKFFDGGEPDSMARLAISQVLLSYFRMTRRPLTVDTRCVVDRTPGGAVHIPRLATLFPDAKFICTLRDPRDAGVSFWFHWMRIRGEAPGASIADFIEHDIRHGWSKTVRASREALASLGEDRCLELDYADHAGDRKGTVLRVLRFLGLCAEGDILEAVLNGSDFRTRSGGREAGQEDRTAFCRKGIVGDWRNHLTEAQGERLLDVAAECLGAHAGVLDRYRGAPAMAQAS